MPTIPIKPLLPAWRAHRSDTWTERLTPDVAHPGEELLYYDGPLIQTCWSRQGEESLWSLYDRGSHKDRWWVVPLTTEVLTTILEHGSYRSAFQMLEVCLLLDEVFPRQKDGLTSYIVHAIPRELVRPQDLPSDYFDRLTLEWARARLLWQAAQNHQKKVEIF